MRKIIILSACLLGALLTGAGVASAGTYDGDHPGHDHGNGHGGGSGSCNAATDAINVLVCTDDLLDANQPLVNVTDVLSHAS